MNTGLAYVYSDYKSSSIQTSSELLASLAKQLAALRSIPDRQLLDLAGQLQGELRRPNVEQCKSLLESLYRQFDRVFLIIDALDELRKRDRAELLAALLKTTSACSILITSRPNHEDIQTYLQEAARLPIRAADADVQSYAYRRIREDLNFARRIKGFEDRVVNEVIAAADGM